MQESRNIRRENNNEKGKVKNKQKQREIENKLSLFKSTFFFSSHARQAKIQPCKFNND